MAGLYIHIPFCKQACHYCDFHFTVSLRHKASLIQAMFQEIKLQKDFFEDTEPLQSVYFGGGTPSLLQDSEIAQFLDLASQIFGIKSEAEITLEANPDDISLNRLKAWRGLGINRLSIGLQSFNDRVLQWTNRAHSADQSQNSVLWTQEAGFSNFSVDMIYGIPLLTRADFETDIAQFLTLKSPHISAYNLTIESGTYFGKQKKRGLLPVLSDSDDVWQMQYALQALQDGGYEQYEISNFAKKGFKAVHNSSYWHGAPYLGIGPSAHSYKPFVRYMNPANNRKYIESITQNQLFGIEEKLTAEDRINEYLLTRLRLASGVNLLELNAMGYDLKNQSAETLAAYLTEELLVLEGDVIKLTEAGKLQADRIVQDFFV